MTKQTIFENIRQGKTLMEIFNGDTNMIQHFKRSTHEFRLPDLPENVTIGIELELALLTKTSIFKQNMMLMGLSDWTIGSDISVKTVNEDDLEDVIRSKYVYTTTVEIKSPVLEGKQLFDGANRLSTLLRLRDAHDNEIGQINKSGGLHIHRGIHWNTDQRKAAGHLIYHLQKDLLSICAGHRINNRYAMLLSGPYIEQGTYDVVRFSNHYPTIEFRIWNATKNAFLIVCFALITNKVCTYIEENYEIILEKKNSLDITLFDVVEDIILINFINNRRRWLVGKAKFDKNYMVIGGKTEVQAVFAGKKRKNGR